MSIAKTILGQINALDPQAMWAWGAKNAVDTGKGLTFKTSGMVRWKGRVRIELDLGKDLYNVSFMRVRAHQLKIDKQLEGVFAEDLVEIIDAQVG